MLIIISINITSIVYYLYVRASLKNRTEPNRTELHECFGQIAIHRILLEFDGRVASKCCPIRSDRNHAGGSQVGQ